MSRVKFKVSPTRRDYNLRRTTDYVTKTTRFYETGLFIALVVGSIFIHLWIFNAWIPIFPRYVVDVGDLLQLFFGMIMVWVFILFVGIYLTFNRVASDSGVAIMGNRGQYCMDIHSIEKEAVPIEDEWKIAERRFRRVKVMRYGNNNGVEKWFGYDGGGRDGCWYATQGSVLLEWLQSKWVPIEAFSVQDGLILKQGVKVGEIVNLILKSDDLTRDAEKITKMLRGEDIMGTGRWTESDLINKIKTGNPYKLIAAHIKHFPHEFIPRWLETIPRELCGRPDLGSPGPITRLKHFNVNAPILAGEDIAIENGGVGSPLQSHAWTRYLSQEKLIIDQEDTIKGLREYILQLEAMQMAGRQMQQPPAQSFGVSRP